jgi:hypothetical protein
MGGEPIIELLWLVKRCPYGVGGLDGALVRGSMDTDRGFVGWVGKKLSD